MKKTFALILSLFLIATSTITCFADAPYHTAGELFREYYNGYDALPDYICGVWSTDGGEENLTFAVQNTEEGNAGKLEIIELVENDLTVSFVYQHYSYNYLCRVQDELLPYLEKRIGIIASGVYQYENNVTLTVREKDRNSNEIVSALKEIKEKYGDAVCIEYLNGNITTTDLTAPMSPFFSSLPENSSSPFFFACAAVLLLFSAAALFFLFRKKALLQTNNGKTHSFAEPVTNKDVENMVKNSNLYVSEELDEKIMKDIEKK